MLSFREIYLSDKTSIKEDGEPSTNSTTLTQGYHRTKFNEVYTRDNIKGGIGDAFDISKIDKKELDLGIETELEHINKNKHLTDKEKRKLALDIAKDHWKEKTNYYTLLKKYVE